MRHSSWRADKWIFPALIFVYLNLYILLVDVLGVVKGVGDVSTVVGRQSQKEVTKREVQLVDQSGMVVNLTLWGSNVSGNSNCLFDFILYVPSTPFQLCGDGSLPGLNQY